MTEQPAQRLAVAADTPKIAALMRASALELFPRFYGQRESASAAVYLTEPDLDLIEDGTYFVHEHDGEIVACGGWSKRRKLYTGSGSMTDDGLYVDPETDPARVRAMFVRRDWTRRGLARAILQSCENAARREGFSRLTLLAILPGIPLYRAYGFEEAEHVMVPLPDGVQIAGVVMHLPLSPVRRLLTHPAG